jgi:hypothetical protein
MMKTRRTFRIIALSFAVVLGTAAYWLVATSRAMTRTPPYKLLLKDGNFELRDYPRLTVVNAPMGAAGRDGSFRKLFAFITGRNDGSEKIAMTTPVLISSAGGERTMGFIMPDNVAAQGVPKPSDTSLSLGQLNAGRFAVLRFSGEHSSANEAHAVEALAHWIATRSLVARGAPVIAYYDPPWTPLFLRRNEVLISVQP